MLTVTKLDADYLPAKEHDDMHRHIYHAVVNEGMASLEPTRVFGVSCGSMYNWFRTYESAGQAALMARKLRPKKSSRRKEHQAAMIVRLIKDAQIEHLHLPLPLGTPKALGNLIKDRSGVRLSDSTVVRYLNRLGFTPQKPLRGAYSLAPAPMKASMQREYPAIARQAKVEKGPIYCGDEIGMRPGYHVDQRYRRKRDTSVIPGTRNRFEFKLLLAFANAGRLVWLVFGKRFAAPVFLKFLQRLAQHTGREFFLILKAHPGQRAEKAKRLLVERHITSRCSSCQPAIST